MPPYRYSCLFFSNSIVRREALRAAIDLFLHETTSTHKNKKMSNVAYLVLVRDQEQADSFNFSRIAQAIDPSDTLAVLCDTSINKLLPPSEAVLFSFQYSLLPEKLGVQVLDKEHILPGSTHLAVIEFFLHHPTYDFYWFIEYDVDYTGDWKKFFSYFGQDTNSDLLAPHIRCITEEPLWYWWMHSSRQISKFPQRLRAFLPIYRMSARMVHGLQDSLRHTQLRAHHEESIPTIAKANGMILRDFGGHGRYVHPCDVNAHYIEGLDNKAGRMLNGSFRYRPEISPHTEIIPQDTLIHPVKRQFPASAKNRS